MEQRVRDGQQPHLHKRKNRQEEKMHFPVLKQPHGLLLVSSIPHSKNRRISGLRPGPLFQVIHCSIPQRGEDNGHDYSNAKVLILGATGRVGSSAARALSRHCPHLNLLLAGRNR